MPDNRIPAAIRLPPGSENEIHRWTFHARNLTSPLNHCQPSHFFFSPQFKTFRRQIIDGGHVFALIPEVQSAKRTAFCLFRTEFVNPARFKRKGNFFAFPACRVQAKERNLRKINLASHRQKRYSPTKKLDEHDKFARRGTISGVTERSPDESNLDFQTAGSAASPSLPVVSIRFQRNF